jgi:hypothetical protein
MFELGFLEVEALVLERCRGAWFDEAGIDIKIILTAFCSCFGSYKPG